MDYVIASAAVTDEIHFPDGSSMEKAAGGAGIYALAGLKIWNDSVELATGVGADYGKLYGQWFEKNNISMNGLKIKSENTSHTIINYFENGEREEVSRYGEEHFKGNEITAEELKPYFQTAKGIYIFRNAEQGFWGEILKFRESSNTKVMWEIAGDAVDNKQLEEVKRIAEKVDVFSINKTEALKLLNVRTVSEAIEILRAWGIPLVFFRQGEEGAYMITEKETVMAESIKDIEVIDSTGGGNSSSGAVLYAYCENIEPWTAGLMGSISAALCLEQYGVPPKLDEQLRERAFRMLEKAQ